MLNKRVSSGQKSGYSVRNQLEQSDVVEPSELVEVVGSYSLQLNLRAWR